MKRIAYICLLFLTVFTVSCEKPKIVYDGEPLLEFKPTVATLAKGTDATPGVVNIAVQLIGKQQGTDLSFQYTVDATSTAVAGTHYKALSGTAVIPANSSSVMIPVTAIPAGFPGSAPAKTLILEIQDGAVKASPNHKKTTITIR